MNVRDSEVICGLLKAEGWRLTANPGEADVVLFNTCSVRQHAEDKVWSEIGRFKDDKRYALSDKPIIGLVGCMAQNYKEKVFERAPQVDFVVGPSDIQKIPGIIERLLQASLACPSKIQPGQASFKLQASNLFERKIWETDGEVRPEEIYRTGFYQDKEHAYVVISEGCSNFCSYCVVPYVRGGLRSRNYKEVLKEIEQAVDRGIASITLLGQNVNEYQCVGVNFPEFVRLVNLVKGLKEFSFITSHPKDTSTDLFKAMAECEKLKKYLHLPVQSGSDRILKLMNRGYDRKFYLDLAKNYRKIVKGGMLSTDIIVGFPTETEEDFQDSYNLVEDIRFDSAYIFKYSVRPTTEAAKMVDDVSKDEKERRHKIILDLQKEISRSAKLKVNPSTPLTSCRVAGANEHSVRGRVDGERNRTVKS